MIMKTPSNSTRALAAAITRAASKQTYLTIGLLVDRERVADAYRAYAYFRWLDDTLDRPGIGRAERLAFVGRQESLMESLYRGDAPHGLSLEEQMLAELVQADHEKNSGLQAYIRNMMDVMVFDAYRRERLISQRELAEYAHSLAVAVTEALYYFIGHGRRSPHDETRYLAVTGAHITHMLRDTLDDLPAGYVNIPRETLQAQGLSPHDVEDASYRKWVRTRVELAREYFRAGHDSLARVESLRCRLAGYAYMARFESVLSAIETDGYHLRASYPECKSALAALRMIVSALLQALAAPNLLAYPAGQPRPGR